MIIFKCGLTIVPLCFIASFSYIFLPESIWIDIGQIIIHAIAILIITKIIYDRHLHVDILGSLTNNPNVTILTNKIASMLAAFVFMGFLVYLTIFMYKMDRLTITAINICMCAFATLYMWLQVLVTIYFSSLYYDEKLIILRQTVAGVSSIAIVVIALSGTISTLLNLSSITFVHYIEYACTYVVAASYCVFAVSYRKDYRYFTEGIHPDPYLDNEPLISEIITETPSYGSTKVSNIIGSYIKHS